MGNRLVEGKWREKGSSSASLLDLPNEIIEKIFSHLNFIDRSKCRVNRKLRKIESNMKMEKESGELWEHVQIKCTPSSEKARIEFVPICPYRKELLPESPHLCLEAFERICNSVKFGLLSLSVDFTSKWQLKMLQTLRMATAQLLLIKDHRGNRDSPVRESEHLNFRFIRLLIKRSEVVHINFVCSSLSFEQIFCLREIIRHSTVGRLSLHLTEEMATTVTDRWMGVRYSSFVAGSRIVRTNRHIPIYSRVLRNTKEEGNVLTLHGHLETFVYYKNNGFGHSVKICMEKHSAETLRDAKRILHRM
ncbi:hypothetical protein PFISCL1PPCAC_18286 [Pristionchus fissidentatus]|uniref:F-box domain-containing protein n=1 Tax=Pristionchus fissidentatus TaxID=1538716 RepID=A0AAV5W4X7_9BILA|nr:hypothetical protein PFISCL1PPCAC_18286 [Pristionchus fissidentatus]